ncbi:hypothetical protein ACQPW1_22430 [Nocardia sp. CA-128927]|uniref:hypothetical protein n=1 Tax=Nocardia sp. CA-128927 TaxID=3239975 RepID=UPI003D96B73E
MTRRTPASTVVLATVWALTVGCGQEYDTGAEVTCSAARFAPPHHNVDPCSGEEVLQAAVAAIFGYEPTVHADPRAAFRTAMPLMTPEFADRAEAAAPVFSPITAATWQQWRTDAVTVTTSARLTDDDHPADTASAISRVLAVDLRPSDDSTTAVDFAVYTHASRTSSAGAWLVSGMEVLG